MKQSTFPLLRLGPLTIKIGSGVTPTGGESSYVSDGIPLIRSQNVVDGWLDLRSVARISAEQHASMSNSIVRPLDVLLNITGASIGRTCVVPNDIEEANVNQHVCIIRCGEQLLPQFLFQYLSSDSGQKQIALCQAGGNRQGLNYQQIAGFQIPLPVCTEQQAICRILMTWDRGIRQLSDLIAAKLRFKQGLMQQLLTGKRRFPEFTDAWTVVPIGSFLTESRIPGTHGAEAKKLTVKLYGKGVIPKSETRAGSEATKYYRRKAGQFIYSKLDFLNGAFGIVPAELDGYESTLDLPAFDIEASVDPDWFRFFVIREDFYKNLLGLANGGRKARRVNPDDLLKVNIRCPAKAEQSRIADVLKTTDREIEILRRELDALKTQKKGLMQKLLTGQVRVPASGGRQSPVSDSREGKS